MAWEKHVSKSTGKTYYFNRATGQSVYERPANYVSGGGGSGSNSSGGKRESRDPRSSSEGAGSEQRRSSRDDSSSQSQKKTKKRASSSGSRSSSSSNNNGGGGGGGGGESDSKRPRGKTLTTSHILVKHHKSRKPKSWRSPDGITRPRKEALAKAERLLAKLKTYDAELLPKCFAKVAQHDSDCSSAKRGGDLGEWTSGQKKFMPAFEAGAVPLAVGELSSIVETSSGYHIILRTK